MDCVELERLLQSLGMSFTSSERRGLVKLFDENGDGKVTYKEFVAICNKHRPGGGIMRSKRGANVTMSSSSPAADGSASMPRSTSQYQEYLASMASSKGMATRSKTNVLSPQSSRTGSARKPGSAVRRPTSAMAASELEASEAGPKLAFSLEFTNVTEQQVAQMAKKAKRHCIQVKKELVILPANRRPRRAALLAASQKAEKFRQSWETLTKLIAAQGEGMVQETLAAMRATIITEDNLVPVVHELVNRFPMPSGYNGEEYEGTGPQANSMGPLYASSASQKASATYEDGDGESTDSEDDMGDLKLLGLA